MLFFSRESWGVPTGGENFAHLPATDCCPCFLTKACPQLSFVPQNFKNFTSFFSQFWLLSSSKLHLKALFYAKNIELPHICFPLKEQWSTRPSSDQRWNMPALHGLVLLLPHCHSWMLSKGVLSGSLTFLRMTSSLTKFSHWEPEEKLEPSHCSTVCIMERPRNCFVSCFLNIFSWIPVLDALLDRMT